MKEKIKFDELTEVDLKNRLAEVAEELILAKQKLRVGQFKKMSEFGRLRKEIARINTVLRSRQIKAVAAAKG